MAIAQVYDHKARLHSYAFETGVPFIALGRESIMEPQLVQKVQAGEEDKIRTTLTGS